MLAISEGLKITHPLCNPQPTNLELQIRNMDNFPLFSSRASSAVRCKWCFKMENHGNEPAIGLQQIIITSKYSFTESQKALEATIPPLDLTTYESYIAKGDYAGARAALEALPTLNNFILPPRNFTNLLLATGESGQAIAYEIGNPLTAAKMIKYNLDIALHTPRRVLLRVNGDKVELKVNALALIVAKYGIPEVDAIAKKLDADLTDTLRSIAGYR
jgi:hypothetical protein